MPTHQDLHIWMTGIVGRAMGSGKYTPDQIPDLARYAKQTFDAFFGPVDEPQPKGIDWNKVQAPDKVDPNYKGWPSSGPPVSQADRNHQREMSGAESMVAEGKPFRLWGNDKIKLGKDKPGPGGKSWSEVTWAEAHRALSGGSAQVRGYLAFLSNLEDKDPKWARLNATIRARAQALLDAAPEGARDETPF